jgi:hypothetical protein
MALGSTQRLTEMSTRWEQIAGDIKMRCIHEGVKELSGLVWLKIESFGALL